MSAISTQYDLYKPVEVYGSSLESRKSREWCKTEFENYKKVEGDYVGK